MSAADFDVIVIGAGANGLTAALALARADRRVLVLERRDVAGGLAVGAEFHPGFRAPGPLIDTSCVRRGLLDDIGGLQEHGLSFAEHGPDSFVAHEHGPGLLIRGDAAAAGEHLEHAAPGDGRAYASYRAFLDRARRWSDRIFDAVPPETTAVGFGGLADLARTALAMRRMGRRSMMELLRVPPMCVADWLNEHFTGTLLKCALAWRGIDGAFMGPWSPGSAANLLRWELMRGPAVRGGAGALIRALQQACEAAGVQVRTGAGVAAIRAGDGAVVGVTLAGGETIDAPIVAASCDPRTVLLGLVARGDLDPALRRRIEHYRMQGTTSQVNLALSAPLPFAGSPDLVWTRACIGASLDDMERAFDHAKYGRCSPRPIVELSMASREDHTLAPQGAAVVSATARFMPYEMRSGPWTDDARQRLGDAVMDEIARVAPAVRDLVIAREVLAPPDIEQRFGVTGGHVFHGEHALDQLLCRPAPQFTRYATPIAGLYLCGAGGHPGGGLTCAAGALAARAILQRLKG